MLKRVKVLTPRVGHAAGVEEIVFIHLFNIGRVAAEEISVACIG
jgi:hypothetical protein